jgi:MFS family permease
MRRNTLLAFAVILVVLAALAAKSLLISMPQVHGGPGEFDARRAKARLAFVLGDQRPHPADSAADDAVRTRIVAELREIGIEPLVRDQLACNGFEKARVVACARVRNVIAILGPAKGKALLLSAHYDSVPVGPGASDDGVGVATLLEVGSLLKERPLKRPVILLFNEGEELGLIGARAFLTDPLSRNVDSVLNFEARGVTGPATMFETSRPNGAAIAAFAGAVRRPVASSLSTDVYHLLPNDTDVSVYNERGWLALNFAMAGNETRYHSPGDDLASLDERSLQHMGDQALALSSELAAGAPPPDGSRVFMDILGRFLVQLPLTIGFILLAPLVIAFGELVRRRRAYGLALAAPVVGILLGSLAGWLATVIVGALRSGTYWRAHPELGFVAIYATVLFGIVAALRTIGAAPTRRQLRVGWWLIFLVVGALVALIAPGGVIYFLAPPIAVLAGIAVSRWWRAAEAIGGLVGLLLLYLTWGEMLALLEVLFSPGPLWVVAPVSAFLIIPALIEADVLFKRSRRAIVIAGSACIALIAWAVTAAAPAYSADRQQRFTIEHVTEFPSRRTFWSVLNDGAPLPRTYAGIPAWHLGKLPFSERNRWLAPAPVAPAVQAPSLQLLDSVTQGNERRIRLRLKANAAERILIIAPAEAHIATAGMTRFIRPIAGADSSGKFMISCAGRSCDGAELSIDLLSAGPTLFTLVGARNGLPASAAKLMAGRPRYARPQYTPDETVAIAQVKL